MDNDSNKACVPAKKQFRTFDGTTGVISEDGKTRVEFIDTSVGISTEQAASRPYTIIAHDDNTVLIGGMRQTLRSDPELAEKIRKAGKLAAECGDFEPTVQLVNVALGKLLPKKER